jgi:molecular chaperone DnaK
MDRIALITPPETLPSTPTEPLRVLGIDLGTTNSTVAEIRWEPGDADAPQVRCLEVLQPTRQGPHIGELVPSVVALHDGQVWVGEGAKDLRTRVKEYDLELYRK